jgi:hypothetical protein
MLDNVQTGGQPCKSPADMQYAMLQEVAASHSDWRAEMHGMHLAGTVQSTSCQQSSHRVDMSAKAILLELGLRHDMDDLEETRSSSSRLGLGGGVL